MNTFSEVKVAVLGFFLNICITFGEDENIQLLVTQAFATATGGTETCEKLANELLHLHSPTTGFQSFALRQRNKSYSKPFFQSVIK